MNRALRITARAVSDALLVTLEIACIGLYVAGVIAGALWLGNVL